jgi:hypothetical protein
MEKHAIDPLKPKRAYSPHMNTFIFRRLLPALLFIVSTFASACSCGVPSSSLQTPLARAEWILAHEPGFVFEGTVDHIELKDWPIKVVPGTVLMRTKVSVTFTSVRIYRGLDSQPPVVVTGIGEGDCGYPFETGRSYLVVAEPDEAGQLSTSICSATYPIEFAGTWLRMLRGEPPAPQDLKDLSLDSVETRETAVSHGKRICGKVSLPTDVQPESLDVYVWKLDKDPKALPLSADEIQTESNKSFCTAALPPGKYLVRAEEGSPQHRGFRYVGYYPGTAQRSEAKPVELSTSKTNPKVEFSLVREPLFELSGRVYGLHLTDVKVMLMGTDPHHIYAIEPVEPGPDGAFKFDNVPPGQYSAFAFADSHYGITFLSSALDVDVTASREGLKLDLVQGK